MRLLQPSQNVLFFSKRKKFRNIALITGASSGIGAAYAIELANRGNDLILVSRNTEKLQKLATQIGVNSKVNIEILMADLSKERELHLVEERIREETDLEVVINNAGFATRDIFTNTDIVKQINMLRVNLEAPIRLCHAALPLMIRRKKGYIINVSSIGAFLHSPTNAIYCTTKRGLLTFSQIIHEELENSGVTIQVVCPGFTYTNFYNTDEFLGGENIKHAIPKFMWMKPDKVVNQSLHDLQRGNLLSIPGWQNKTVIFLARLGISGLFSAPVIRKLRQTYN